LIQKGCPITYQEPTKRLKQAEHKIFHPTCELKWRNFVYKISQFEHNIWYCFFFRCFSGLLSFQVLIFIPVLFVWLIVKFLVFKTFAFKPLIKLLHNFHAQYQAQHNNLCSCNIVSVQPVQTLCTEEVKSHEKKDKDMSFNIN